MENSKSSCELCSSPATTYCESDRARLCWHCDGKVHKANFLVSKHCRTLLCHLCNKPTPWTASGPMLPPSLSFCVACASTTSSRHAAAVMTPVQSAHLPLAHDENDGAYESYDDDDDEDEDEDTDEDEEEEGYSRYTGGDDLDGDEEDDDNQVVPLTTSSSSSSSIVTSNNVITRGLNNVSCSSSNEAEDEDEDENEEDNEGDDGRISSMMLPSSLKRKRQFYMLS